MNAQQCECCGARLSQLNTGALICPKPACPNPTTIPPAQLRLA